MHRGRLGQMGWRPLWKGSLSASGLFSQSVPGPQMFGNVPMLSLTWKTPWFWLQSIRNASVESGRTGQVSQGWQRARPSWGYLPGPLCFLSEEPVRAGTGTGTYFQFHLWESGNSSVPLKRFTSVLITLLQDEYKTWWQMKTHKDKCISGLLLKLIEGWDNWRNASCGIPWNSSGPKGFPQSFPKPGPCAWGSGHLYNYQAFLIY